MIRTRIATVVLVAGSLGVAALWAQTPSPVRRSRQRACARGHWSPRALPPKWRFQADAGGAGTGQRGVPEIRRVRQVIGRAAAAQVQPLMLLQSRARQRRDVHKRSAPGPRHEGFVERAKQGDIDLLLHGDSITDGGSGRP